MTHAKIPSLFALAALALGSGACTSADSARTVRVQYLEVVTADVDATCSALEKLHGVRFGAPEEALGNARTAALAGGGRIGVRAPLRADEDPVVRPYVFVDDIEAAVKTAQAAGGDFAMLATDTPGLCRFAIYFQGGIQHGLWQPVKD